uniref:Uncharacterized protein n=2 Tax=Cyprinus carpio TaxID=7962 RepID=A0A9J7YGC3_CYPCA
MFNSLWKVTPAHRGTLTEISDQAPCDLTLFTCLLIGSYCFCIIPLLSALCGKPKTQLWSTCLCFIALILI